MYCQKYHNKWKS